MNYQKIEFMVFHLKGFKFPNSANNLAEFALFLFYYINQQNFKKINFKNNVVVC
jgi:hypothetical protein